MGILEDIANAIGQTASSLTGGATDDIAKFLGTREGKGLLTALGGGAVAQLGGGDFATGAGSALQGLSQAEQLKLAAKEREDERKLQRAGIGASLAKTRAQEKRDLERDIERGIKQISDEQVIESFPDLAKDAAKIQGIKRAIVQKQLLGGVTKQTAQTLLTAPSKSVYKKRGSGWFKTREEGAKESASQVAKILGITDPASISKIEKSMIR